MWIKTEILFANLYDNNQTVSNQEWVNFIDNIVTPFFPQGLTIRESFGQMFDNIQIRKQKNYELMIVHENNKKNSNNLLTIINTYKKQFSGVQVFMFKTKGTSTFFN